MKQESTGARYCKVCLLPHDEEIHQATLAVRQWHHWQVVQGLEESQDEPAVTEEFEQPQVA